MAKSHAPTNIIFFILTRNRKPKQKENKAKNQDIPQVESTPRD